MDRRRMFFLISILAVLAMGWTLLKESRRRAQRAQRQTLSTPAVPMTAESIQTRPDLLEGGPPTTTSFVSNLEVNTSTTNITAAVSAKTLRDLRARSKVWMSPQEMSMIESYMEPTDTVLEFGSGWSTLYFSQFVRNYYAVEYNTTWYKEMQSLLAKVPHGNVHLTLAAVQPGFKGWDGGQAEGTYDQFEKFIEAVDYLEVKHFDRVIIDSRARRYCAEHVLKYLNATSVVFLHDYKDREEYQAPIKDGFYKQVAEIHEGQGLLVMRPS